MTARQIIADYQRQIVRCYRHNGKRWVKSYAKISTLTKRARKKRGLTL